jgi:ribosomal protein S19
MEMELELIEVNQEITIVDKMSYEQALEVVSKNNSNIKRIEKYWSEPIEQAHKAHKNLIAKKNEMLFPFNEFNKSLKTKINSYLAIESEKRRKLELQLEKERLEKERLEKERLKEELKKTTNLELKKEIKNEIKEMYIPVQEVEKTFEVKNKLEFGTVSTKEEIEISIVNPIEILRQIVDGNLPTILISFNESNLKKYVKTNQLKKLSGLKIEFKQVANFRSK